MATIKTPMNPCDVCYGIERFPKSMKCVACLRKENGAKARIILSKCNFHIDKPQLTKEERFREKEREIMAGVRYV